MWAYPTPRTYTSMAYDPKAPTIGPPPRTQHCSTYDESLEKVVVVSGNQESTLEPDTWLFGYE